MKSGVPFFNPALADKEYYSIGEASELVQIQPYVLRYWESEFKLLRPIRRESGHRKYTRTDIETISKIKELLHFKGFTIAGAKKFLQQEKQARPEQIKMELEETGAATEILKETKETLEEILQILR